MNAAIFFVFVLCQHCFWWLIHRYTLQNGNFLFVYLIFFFVAQILFVPKIAPNKYTDAKIITVIFTTRNLPNLINM